MKLTPKGEALVRRVVSLLVLAILNAVVSMGVSLLLHLNYWGVLLVVAWVPFMVAEYKATLDSW